MKNHSVSDYFKLRDEVDNICSKLHTIHAKSTACKMGCSSCCMNFSVFPVEFYVIREEIKSRRLKVEHNGTNDACIFLHNHNCTIYNSRPFICRSHGLPILAMDAEGENWELSFCPLNFNHVNDDYFSFENSFDQDTINSKLYQINQKFLQTKEGKQFENEVLIEVSKLKEFLT